MSYWEELDKETEDTQHLLFKLKSGGLILGYMKNGILKGGFKDFKLKDIQGVFDPNKLLDRQEEKAKWEITKKKIDDIFDNMSDEKLDEILDKIEADNRESGEKRTCGNCLEVFNQYKEGSMEVVKYYCSQQCESESHDPLVGEFFELPDDQVLRLRKEGFWNEKCEGQHRLDPRMEHCVLCGERI